MTKITRESKSAWLGGAVITMVIITGMTFIITFILGNRIIPLSYSILVIIIALLSSTVIELLIHMYYRRGKISKSSEGGWKEALGKQAIVTIIVLMITFIMAFLMTWIIPSFQYMMFTFIIVLVIVVIEEVIMHVLFRGRG